MKRANIYLSVSLLVIGSAGATQAQVLETGVARLTDTATPENRQPAKNDRQFGLTLDDAIERALERNLDIAVERLVPQAVDLTLAQQQAFYRPTVSTSIASTSQISPSRTQLDGGETRRNRHGNVQLLSRAASAMGWGEF